MFDFITNGDVKMTLKNELKTQLTKIKNNWLIVLLVVAVLFVSVFSGNFSSVGELSRSRGDLGIYAEGMAMPMAEPAAYKIGGFYNDDGFAPEITERKVTNTANLNSEIERGKFNDAVSKLKAVVSGTDSYLLNENVYKSGEGWSVYHSGNYQIKVESSKYDAVILQLKEIGEVTSFNENARDITASYTNVQAELEVEKSRLERYQKMYAEAKQISDKINLNDRIFDQERKIKYLEDSLNNKELQVEYSTVYVSLVEERSGYAGMTVVKFSQLVKKLVGSFNSVLSLLFWAIPWVVIGIVVWLGVKYFRKK